MTVSELQALLKRPTPPTGCFLFCGEEAYLRRSYLDMFRRKILTDPAFDTFNHILHSGAEPDFSLLTADLETAPFFADVKLIEWHMAELTGFTDKKIEALTELCALQGRENNAALIIVCAPEGFDPGTSKRPSALYRKLSQVLNVIVFEKSTDAQLMNWLKRHFDHEGVEADAPALRAMLERCGHSMDVLANEVTKLVCYLKANGRTALTPADIPPVCSPTTESDAFGLTNAMLDGNSADAFYHLRDLRARRVDPTVILGQLSRLFGDLLSVSLLLRGGMNQAAIASALSMNAYKVSLYIKAAAKKSPAHLRRALAALAAADRTVKTSYGTDQWRLLDCLVADLLR